MCVPGLTCPTTMTLPDALDSRLPPVTCSSLLSGLAGGGGPGPCPTSHVIRLDSWLYATTQPAGHQPSALAACPDNVQEQGAVHLQSFCRRVETSKLPRSARYQFSPVSLFVVCETISLGTLKQQCGNRTKMAIQNFQNAWFALVRAFRSNDKI